jgi:hypothetical protein
MNLLESFSAAFSDLYTLYWNHASGSGKRWPIGGIVFRVEHISMTKLLRFWWIHKMLWKPLHRSGVYRHENRSIVDTPIWSN